MLSELSPEGIAQIEAVRRECEPYIDMTMEERGKLLLLACIEAERLARVGMPDGQRNDTPDPLPQSSIDALARLRAEYKAKLAKRMTK